MLLKYVHSAFVVAALGLAGTAVAGEYQIQVGAALVDGSIDTDALDDDIRGRAFSASTFFGVVEDGNGPLAEAPFIDRASSLSISFLDTDTDETDVETEDFGIAIRLVDAESGWTFGLGFDSGTVGSTDTEALSLSVGNYVAETTEIGFTFVFSDEESNATGKEDSESWAFTLDHLFNGALPVAIAAELGSVDVDGESEQLAGVAATVYPIQSLGIGAAYELIDGEEEVETTGAFVEWYFTRTYAVSASYLVVDSGETELGDTESDLVSLGITGRF